MGVLTDVENELRHVIATLQDIDLWPPWDALETVEDALNVVWDVAVEPPPPDPETVLQAASRWSATAVAADFAVGDSDNVVALTPTTAWEGTAGDAMRTSVRAYATRVDTVRTSAQTVNAALCTLSDAMTSARSRHDRAYGEVLHSIQVHAHFDPRDVLRDLEDSVKRAVGGLEDLIGAYGDAAAAVQAAADRIRPAEDALEFPDRLGSDSGAVATIDAWTGPTSGPLKGTVLQRADAAIAAMSPADRARVQQLLDGSSSPQQRAWILAAVATGASVPVLAAFAARTSTMTPAQLRALDPTTRTGSTTDPGSPFLEGSDATTCGSDSLVMAQMINDPVVALRIMTGYDATTGTGPTGPSTDAQIHQRFLAAADAMHTQTNTWQDHTGDPQLPWPKSLGTLPSAASNAMNGPGGTGVPGSHYGFQVTDPQDRGSQYDQIASAASSGHAVPLYVGDSTAPRHIVLVTGTDGGDLTVYDPSKGVTCTVSRDAYTGDGLGLGNWPQAWGAVLPG